MLQLDQVTCAPRAVRVSMRTAVWIVMWRLRAKQNEMQIQGKKREQVDSPPSDPGTSKGLVLAVLGTESDETWHLELGELDFLTAESGEGDVCDLFAIQEERERGVR